eukprot:1227916-Lingulodinium_polyedra.AAC.1
MDRLKQHEFGRVNCSGGSPCGTGALDGRHMLPLHGYTAARDVSTRPRPAAPARMSTQAPAEAENRPSLA